MIDQVGALVTHLKTVSEVTDLVTEDRVFGLELPKSEAANMPRNAVVLSLSGGIGPFGARDDLQLAYTRIDGFCYGTTGLNALLVQAALHDAMKAISNTVAGTALLRSATIESGPRYFRDQDTDWPVMIETYLLMVSECALS